MAQQQRPLFGLLPTLGDLEQSWDEITDIALDRRVRLAVTGLRHSGKTVFISALAHHLLDGRHLAFLKVAHEGRYIGAKLLPQGYRDPKPFPFARYVELLDSDPPAWPKATDDLTGLTFRIRFRPSGFVARQLSSMASLRLELVDYPGEWLLDLPLLDTDFDGFARGALGLMDKPVRAPFARPYLERLDTIDPGGPADPVLAAELAELFTDYLLACQRDGHLSLIQPGRFTMPGSLKGSQALQFAPVPPGENTRGSLRRLMADRYTAYKREVVYPFYEQHFSRFDRQIVLVDVMSALNEGPGVFDDTEIALSAVLQSFNYGRSSLLSRLFSPKIDKLLFAASKADHVSASQHANLKNLLGSMVARAARTAKFEGVDTDTLALSAIRCTDTVKRDYQGQTLSYVRGRLKKDGSETVLYPGEIPPDMPEASDWQEGRFRFKAFAPRPLSSEGGRHIRLDTALEFLIGDRLL